MGKFTHQSTVFYQFCDATQSCIVKREFWVAAVSFHHFPASIRTGCCDLPYPPVQQVMKASVVGVLEVKKP